MKGMSKKCSTDQRFILKEITSLKIHTLVYKSNLKNHFIGDAGSATASVNVCQSPARTCSRTSSKKSNQSTLISNGKGTYV